MKTLILIITAVAALAFTGCSTVDSSQPSPLHREVEAANSRATSEENLRKTYEVGYNTQKSEIERLHAENATLMQSQKTSATNDQICARLLYYLQVNDYLLENHETVVKHFNSEYTTKRDVLFSAAGGTGKLLDFEVDDVFLYKGVVVVSSLCLWQNTDGSGGVGRCALSLDPDKDFDAVRCEMTGRAPLSRQDLASLFQGNGTAPSPQQLEQVATQVPVQPSSSTKPLLSEATKDKLISAGIGVVSAWLIHAINSGQ